MRAESSTGAGGSIARRVSVIGSVSLALVLLGICAVMSLMLTAGARDRIVTWAGDKAAAVVDTSDGFDLSARETVERLFAVFKRDFDTLFEHDPKTGDLKNFGASLADNFTTVDQFQHFTGGVATIFSIKGDDFYRISTSLKKQDGERALGTALGKSHPAYANLMANKPYVGRAILFGKPYMTRYEPALDKDRKVVGALFIGFDLTPFQASLEKLVDRSRFFENGGTVVIDPRGSLAEAVFVVHPTARGKKVLEAVPGAETTLAAPDKAEDGRVAIRNVRRKAKDQIDKLVKDGETGEDDGRRAEKELDDVTHRYVAVVDELVKHKEAELLEV